MKTSVKILIRTGALFLLFLIPVRGNAQDSLANDAKVPFMKLFYKLGPNTAGSITYDYGIPYLLAAAATYGAVQSGIDWKWYSTSNNHAWISNAGFASVLAGMLVPVTVPVGTYLAGRYHENADWQITGLALGQAAALGLAISSGIKVFTGRVPPDNASNHSDYSGDFRFGFLRGGAFDGWPSSHTTVAFAMAAALTELHPDNVGLELGSFAYASLIGLGVSTNIHWFSDAVAGAFIGYAIGKSVGMGFSNLKNASGKKPAYGFYVLPTGGGVTRAF